MGIKLDILIDEAKRELHYHLSRGKKGDVEALASRVRIRALEDAKKAVEDERTMNEPS
jgi:hypothetical protein